MPLEFNDVTASSFAEQDRVNNDMDDLMGSFSQGSVSTNRKLNETVGGMAMLRGTSTAMTQYVIRVFTETWVEKVLNHLDMLEQHYESDIDLLNLMGRRANIEKHGITAVTKDLLMVPSQIIVNVSNSAMDPMLRLNAFTQAMDMYAKFRQIMPPDMDPEPIKSYIFGLLGFRDASRFSVDNENPQIQSLLQENQSLKQALETKMLEIDKKNETTFAKIESDERIKTAELMSEEDIAEMEGMIDLVIADMGKENDENRTINVETTKRMMAKIKEKAGQMKVKSRVQ